MFTIFRDIKMSLKTPFSNELPLNISIMESVLNRYFGNTILVL